MSFSFRVNCIDGQTRGRPDVKIPNRSAVKCQGRLGRCNVMHHWLPAFLIRVFPCLPCNSVVIAGKITTEYTERHGIKAEQESTILQNCPTLEHGARLRRFERIRN